MAWISSPVLVSCGPTTTLAVGTSIGHYLVDKLIGSGGMGEVYKARDTKLNRDVALKVLPAGDPPGATRLARFTREAYTTALLNHPNIVTIYDVGSHAGVPFVVSELLTGQTLRNELRDGALPLKKAVRHALEIAHGLVAAHQLGIVHRDLKPENVFITRDGRVKILDFGLAKWNDQTLGVLEQDSSNTTRPGTILGTVGYMSPEQVQGRAADHRSDIFSLGVILYEMIAGTAPFRGDSPVETLHAILKDDPPSLRDGDGCISETFERVVWHCLEKRADARFQSARDLIFSVELAYGSERRTERRPKNRTAFRASTRRLLSALLQLV